VPDGAGYYPQAYNEKVGLALFCPITTRQKGYPFEVKVLAGLNVTGVILCNQIKSLDWRMRQAELLAQLSPQTMSQVLQKINTLIVLA
jgi:mRNA interferase MazF